MRLPYQALNNTATVRAHICGPVFAKQTTVGCRVELSEAIQTSADGTETPVTAGRAFLPAGMRVPPGSEITIDGRTYRTTSENRPQSAMGAAYTEVRFR